MADQQCACPDCECIVDANAQAQGGEAYCCEACASGHKGGNPCRMPGCHCGESDKLEREDAL